MSATGYVKYQMRTVLHCAVGAIIRIPALLEELDAKKVLMISDQGVKEAGIVDRVAGVFETNGADSGVVLVGISDTIGLDATISSINEAVRHARDVDADAILAVGGGSVIDASKAVKYALDRNIADLSDVIQGGMIADLNGLPSPVVHIAVPTTAGTGAEVIPGGMVYNEATGAKVALHADYIEPDVAVLDPQLTLSLPSKLTAMTGFDTLSHGLEALCSPTANTFSDAHALLSMQITQKVLPGLVADGSGIDARSSMLNASTMATNALLHAGGYQPVHVVAHALGSLYHIHHGECLTAAIPAVLRVLADYYQPNARRIGQAINMKIDESEPSQMVLERVIAEFEAFSKDIGLESNLKSKSFPQEDVATLTRIIVTDPFAMMFPIPPELAAQIIMEII